MLPINRLSALLWVLAQFGDTDAFTFDRPATPDGRILSAGQHHRGGATTTALGSANPNAPAPHPAPGSHPVRFLGRGPNAIVRPGCVLVAPAHEASNALMKTAVFVRAVGEDDEGTTVVRGVVIDYPTAFTMGEMAPGTVYGALGSNILFRGGQTGNDAAMLLHCRGADGDAVAGCGEMIGASGIYEGGLQAALDAAESGTVEPGEFKFFFNFVEFTERQLEEMLEEVDDEGDAWMSVEVPKDMVLDGDFNRGEAWKYIRNQISQMGIE